MNDSFALDNSDEQFVEQGFYKPEIYLNPGTNYQIKPNDTCFYISLVKEENYELKLFKLKICKQNKKNC